MKKSIGVGGSGEKQRRRGEGAERGEIQRCMRRGLALVGPQRDFAREAVKLETETSVADDVTLCVDHKNQAAPGTDGLKL